MSIIEYEQFRKRRIKYLPQAGDVFYIKPKGIDRFFHCKIIENSIVSEDPFVNNCSLVYLFAPQDGLFITHSPDSFISAIIFYFNDQLPETFEMIGNEELKKWEKDVDIGIEGKFSAKMIHDTEVYGYTIDHKVIKMRNGDNIAIPFYDCKANILDHVPKIQLPLGYTTERGLFEITDNWLKKNNMV